jgi:hypothetical protein
MKQLMIVGLVIVMRSSILLAEHVPLAESPKGTQVQACSYEKTPTKTDPNSEFIVVFRVDKRDVNVGALSPLFGATVGKVLSMNAYHHAGPADPKVVDLVSGRKLKQRASKQIFSKGVQTMRMDYDGKTELASKSGEEWSQKAPDSTFFTSRGNFIGTFLSEKAGDNIPKGFLAAMNPFDFTWGLQTFNLTCTSDEKVLRDWIAKASAFSPL